MRKYLSLTLILPIMMTFSSCDASEPEPAEFTGAEGEVRLMTLNPGHFHAALVQMSMIHQVNPEVHVYAPDGTDLDLHLQRIEDFNTREEDPTSWELNVHRTDDYLERMLEERPGNVMVTAGNNRQKTAYLHEAVSHGIHGLSDKPMAIDREGWERLVNAFRSAEEHGVLLYDIMTERYEITSVLQRELAQNRELFGELRTGSPDDPAIIKESVHHLYKTVAGQTLRRPAWYFDVEQQGEGIVDVTTHLVDLTMWGGFPGHSFDHESDVEMIRADRWPTVLTQEEFTQITAEPEFPDYLQDQLVGGDLPYYSNGEMVYTLNGHHARVHVQWDYEAPEGSDDTHFSMMRGTRADLVIRQGEEQDYTSTLYVEPAEGVSSEELRPALESAVETLRAGYSGLEFSEVENGWRLDVPDEHYLGHEAHFGKVAEAFFGYLVDGELPEWEVPNMITKYHITTAAREMALQEE